MCLFMFVCIRKHVEELLWLMRVYPRGGGGNPIVFEKNFPPNKIIDMEVNVSNQFFTLILESITFFDKIAGYKYIQRLFHK